MDKYNKTNTVTDTENKQFPVDTEKVEGAR